MPLDTQGKCVGIRLQRFDHTVIGKGRWNQMRCRGLDNLMVIRISEGIRAKEPVEYTVFRKCYFVGRVTSMECLLKMTDAAFKTCIPRQIARRGLLEERTDRIRAR